MKQIILNGVSIEESTKIKFLVKSNPKRSGSQAAQRFDKYMDTRTVGDYFEAGAVRGDLKYDWEHGFIEIVGVKSVSTDAA